MNRRAHYAASAALALVFAASLVGTAGAIKLKKAENFEAAMAEAKKTNKPILLDFYAPW